MLRIWTASLSVFVANLLIDVNVLELFAKSRPFRKVVTSSWNQ